MTNERVRHVAAIQRPNYDNDGNETPFHTFSWAVPIVGLFHLQWKGMLKSICMVYFCDILQPCCVVVGVNAEKVREAISFRESAKIVKLAKEVLLSMLLEMWIDKNVTSCRQNNGVTVERNFCSWLLDSSRDDILETIAHAPTAPEVIREHCSRLCRVRNFVKHSMMYDIMDKGILHGDPLSVRDAMMALFPLMRIARRTKYCLEMKILLFKTFHVWSKDFANHVWGNMFLSVRRPLDRSKGSKHIAHDMGNEIYVRAVKSVLKKIPNVSDQNLTTVNAIVMNCVVQKEISDVMKVRIPFLPVPIVIARLNRSILHFALLQTP